MVENLLGLGSMALNQIPEGIDIRGFDRVQADPLVHRAFDPDHPALPANLDRNIQSGMLHTGRRSDSSPEARLLSLDAKAD